jgi:hypothetical protein
MLTHLSGCHDGLLTTGIGYIMIDTQMEGGFGGKADIFKASMVRICVFGAGYGGRPAGKDHEEPGLIRNLGWDRWCGAGP